MTARELLAKLESDNEPDWIQASTTHYVRTWPPSFLARVVTIVETSPHEMQRYHAACLLGREFKSQQAAGALFAAFVRKDESPLVRGLAAEQLAWATIDRRKIVGAYLRGTYDPSPIVRFWCIYGLATLRANVARERLRELAATDEGECPGWGRVSTEAKWALAVLDNLPMQDRLAPLAPAKLAQLENPSRTAFLRRAIELAASNVRDHNGGPFGAVIVRGKEIAGEGANRVVLFNDPTAHAEIVAIRDACRRLQTFDLSGCEIYCSCEPNPMCLGAIYWARLSRIHYAASRDDAARAGFNDLDLYAEVARPVGERRLPTRNLLRRQGRAPFAAWEKSPIKILY